MMIRVDLFPFYSVETELEQNTRFNDAAFQTQSSAANPSPL